MRINWTKLNGLLPVIATQKGKVLMLAYMDEAALDLTLQTGFAHYFSRTKNRIWKKGEESGNTQKILSAKLDCDSDALLLEVEQIGPACHTGAKSCFFNEINAPAPSSLSSPNTPIKYDILDHLYHIALNRKLSGDGDNSYIAKLYQKGENSYLKKIVEEAGELVCALKDLNQSKKSSELNGLGEHKELFKTINGREGSIGEICAFDAVYEATDLLFHIIVALANSDIHPEQILRELERRNGLSGIAEKEARR